MQGGGGVATTLAHQPACAGEGLRQAARQLQGGFGAAARRVLLAPAASVRAGDVTLGTVVPPPPTRHPIPLSTATTLPQERLVPVNRASILLVMSGCALLQLSICRS